MGNANGREEVANIRDDPTARSNGDSGARDIYAPNSTHPARVASSDSMGNTPPQSPGRSRSPLMFAPQVSLPFFSFVFAIFLCVCLVAEKIIAGGIETGLIGCG